GMVYSVYMTLKSYAIIGAIVMTLLMSGIAAAASPVIAGDRNCDAEPNHKYCNGAEGAQGMVFCDIGGVGRGEDCYDRDFSSTDCDEHPGHSRCTGTQGREGNMFGDIQYQDLGYYDNCYDRKILLINIVTNTQ
ncbi:MAG: hypothetical protein ACREAS_08160, partial [Nitrososphaera sp.]